MITVDVEQFRDLFPFYQSRRETAYLDNATAKLIATPILEAFNEPMNKGYLIARKGSHHQTAKATEILEMCRETVASWHGSRVQNVIFQPTISLANLLIAESIAWELSKGILKKEGKSTCLLLISPDTHNSIYLPWINAARRWQWQWKVLDARFLDPKNTINLLESQLENIKNDDVHVLLLLSDVSMVLGWTPPISSIVKTLKKHDGQLLLDASRGYQFTEPRQRWKNADFIVANMGTALWMPHGLAITIKNSEWPSFPPSFISSNMVKSVTTHSFEVESPPLGL